MSSASKQHIDSKEWMTQISQRSGKLIEQIDHLTGGAATAILHAYKSFNLVFAFEAAAAISYYALFSLFPLFLLLVSLTSLFLVNADGTDVLTAFLIETLNIPAEEINDFLGQFSATSEIGGLIGLVTLIWAATGMLTSLARNISRAWPEANVVSALQGRLMAVIMIGFLIFLQIFWWLVTTVLNYLAKLETPLLDRYIHIAPELLTDLTLNGITLAIFFLGFIGLYRFVPKTTVRWREAFFGALFATLATFLATRVYTWFLQSGFASYDLIYGSLGSILGLLVLVYINAFIILFGAHLSSGIAYVHRQRKAARLALEAGISLEGEPGDEPSLVDD
jgi:membrane protein